MSAPSAREINFVASKKNVIFAKFLKKRVNMNEIYEAPTAEISEIELEIGFMSDSESHTDKSFDIEQSDIYDLNW